MWHIEKNSLHKEFTFTDFEEAFRFMTEVAAIAEEQNHHPRWQNEWNRVSIWLNTHDQGDKVTDKDRKLAESIDGVYKQFTSSTESVSDIKIYTDGGSRGNPGPAASGFVLIAENGDIVLKKGVYLGITTNNQAEYQALKLALEAAKTLKATNLDIYMDSLLIVNQIKGTYKVKNAELLPLYNSIKKLIEGFNSVSFTHVPRALNKLADAMVNEALDEAAGSA